MNTFESMSIYILLISNALLVAAAGLAIMRFQRFYRHMQQFWYSPTGTSLIGQQEEEIRRSLRTTRRLDARVNDMQRVIRTLATRDLSKSAAVERALPIDNAVRMIKHGASVEDLTRNCGLNIGEARLLQKLHGKAHASARTDRSGQDHVER